MGKSFQTVSKIRDRLKFFERKPTSTTTETASNKPWDVSAVHFLEGFRREMDHLMDQFFGSQRSGEGLAAFTPRANVAETETAYEVSVDLPGMKPEDIELELKHNQLWISGQREEEKEEEGKTYHLIERSFGRFRKVIPLEVPVNAEGVEAFCKDGILRITLPKEPSARTKKIEIRQQREPAESHN